MRKKLKVAVSACLMGFRYRYDGKDKLCEELIRQLGNKVDLIPVCPEVECGLDIPRPPMKLVTSPKGTRLKVISSGEDVTDCMTEWAMNKVEQLSDRDIVAFLFKSKSPSCGLHSSMVFDPAGLVVTEKGSGIFAKILTRRFPKLVVGEEIELEKFIKQLNLDLFGNPE